MARLIGPWLALLVVAALAAGGARSDAAASKLKKPNIRIVLDVPIASHLPIYIAQYRGLFRAEGLNTELAVLRSAPEALAVYLATSRSSSRV